MKPNEPVETSRWEIAGIIALCFGWPIAGSIASVLGTLGIIPATAKHPSFSDSYFLRLVLFELCIGSLALLILRQRGYALKELLPTPTLKGSLIGALLYVGACVAGAFAIAPFALHHAKEPIDQLMANAAPSMLVVLLLGVVNGLYEEVFVLGYLVRGLGKYGGSFAIGVSSLIRLLYHLYQGPLGALSIVVFSIVVGTYYWRTRNLWPVVCAHTLADILPFLLLAAK